MLTNAVLQKIINDTGDRIYAFGIDNSSILYIGYSSSPKLSDIELVNIDGVDFVKVNRTSRSQGKELKFANYILTEYIQWIGIMDEKDKDYRPDPLTLK